MSPAVQEKQLERRNKREGKWGEERMMRWSCGFGKRCHLFFQLCASPFNLKLESWIQFCAWQPDRWHMFRWNISLWCLSLTELLNLFFSSFQLVCLQMERLNHNFFCFVFPAPIKRSSTSLSWLCSHAYAKYSFLQTRTTKGQIIGWHGLYTENDICLIF